jgi:hypothetical protein
MPFPNASSNDKTDTGVADDLPLFRPEAIAAQRQKFYGEIILIQPFSLTFLTTLAVVLAAIVFGFVFFGYHTQRVRVSGILPARNASGERRSLADLYVPARAMPFVHVGDSLFIRCSACTPMRQRGTVQEISARPLQPAEIASETGVLPRQPLYGVTVALDRSNRLPSRTKIESDLALQRQPLLKWLFEDSPSSAK